MLLVLFSLATNWAHFASLLLTFEALAALFFVMFDLTSFLPAFVRSELWFQAFEGLARSLLALLVFAFQKHLGTAFWVWLLWRRVGLTQGLEL